MKEMKINRDKLGRAAFHPMRERIILALADSGEGLSPNKLSKLLGAKLGNVSYHVKQLRDAAVLVPDGTETRRGAVEHFYRLAPGVVSDGNALTDEELLIEVRRIVGNVKRKRIGPREAFAELNSILTCCDGKELSGPLGDGTTS